MWRWIIGIAIVLLLVGGAVWQELSATTPVEAAPVHRSTIRAFVEEQARTRLPRIHHITMPLDARILPISIEEDDTVTAGQVVARIDDADLHTAVVIGQARIDRLKALITQTRDNSLENTALEEVELFLRSVADTVAAARKQTVASEARYRFAARQLERYRELLAKNSINEEDVEAAEVRKIESDVDWKTDELTLSAISTIEAAFQLGPRAIREYIAKKAHDRAVYAQELNEAQAELERVQRDLQRATITSPVDGVVLKRHESSERVLTAGAPLLDVGRLQELEIEAEILTREVVEVKIGDPVDIFGPAVGSNPIPGKVKRINPQGFTKVSSLGVEQQRVLVIIALTPEAWQQLEQAGRDLGVDYRVQVRIYTDQRDNTLTIPRTALFRSADGKWQVFAIREGRTERVALEVGLMNDHRVEVLSGLNEKDQVVLAPESDLREGQRVSTDED